MSRSRRKTPIMGITTARSEREDKTIWHQRMRAHERTRLAKVSLDEPDSLDHVAVSEREVSNPWGMAKDGRQYFSPKRQEKLASLGYTRANPLDLTPSQYKARYLHKVMGK